MKIAFASVNISEFPEIRSNISPPSVIWFAKICLLINFSSARESFWISYFHVDGQSVSNGNKNRIVSVSADSDTDAKNRGLVFSALQAGVLKAFTRNAQNRPNCQARCWLAVIGDYSKQDFCKSRRKMLRHHVAFVIWFKRGCPDTANVKTTGST